MNISNIRSALILGKEISARGAAALLRQENPNIDIHFFDDATPGIKTLKLERFDVLVASPGFDPKKHFLVLEWLQEKGRETIISEIDLAMEYAKKFARKKIILVTGTNGKSTIVHLIHHGLNKLGRKTFLGGNFGVPPSLYFAEHRTELDDLEYVILELSSYQLEWCRFRWQADLAIFANFSEDHIARHETLANYFATKWTIGRLLKTTGHLLITKDIEAKRISFQLPIETSAHFVFPKLRSINLPFFQMPHNAENVSIAIKAIETLESIYLNSDEIFDLFKDYRGLNHRCEMIGNFFGSPVVNDSKATNVASTLVALRAFTEGNSRMPLTLLLGGAGKGESFLPLTHYKNHIKNLLIFGKSKDSIAKDLAAEGIPFFAFATIFEALDFLVTENLFRNETTTILLSPACASFDSFKNFEERGDFFRQKFFNSPGFESYNA